ncbi:hypothetical protein [Ruegeria sp. HKCCD6604]|uniref:hypothetical protein n=1 Tax=Ruegeria sp. HKCCD6604 TaxID=2683000 RepID=UPI00149206FE|nr:hypothetical protein [Ruegeria sp. HKCCD6604]NOC91936.1 hypothetical protein [Ruegeria sp. HKCCD6604]
MSSGYLSLETLELARLAAADSALAAKEPLGTFPPEDFAVALLIRLTAEEVIEVRFGM